MAEWIDYTGRTGQLLNNVDEEEKLMHTIYSLGQNREMWFLTEDGLYEVLMQSRKPIAKQFKKKGVNILATQVKHGGFRGNMNLNNVKVGSNTRFLTEGEKLVSTIMILGQNRETMLNKIDEEEKIKVFFKSTSSKSTQEQWFLKEDEKLRETIFTSDITCTINTSVI